MHDLTQYWQRSIEATTSGFWDHWPYYNLMVASETREHRTTDRSSANMTAKTPPSSVTVRVVIVDRLPTVREGLTNRLNADPNIDVVGTAATPDEALSQVTTLNADIAIIDAQLPDDTGPRLCYQIRERHPTTQCVLHTALTTDHKDVDHDGAAAVVVKQLFGNELTNTIHKLASNHRDH